MEEIGLKVKELEIAVFDLLKKFEDDSGLFVRKIETTHYLTGNLPSPEKSLTSIDIFISTDCKIPGLD